MNKLHNDSDALKHAKKRFSSNRRVQRVNQRESSIQNKQATKPSRSSVNSNHKHTTTRTKPTHSFHEPPNKFQPTTSIRPTSFSGSAGQKIRMMHRPNFLQVMSAKQNLQLYHVTSRPQQRPPQIICQPTEIPITTITTDHQVSTQSPVEKIQGAVWDEFAKSQPQFLDEIQNLRKELKKDIADVIHLVELLTQEQQTMKMQICSGALSSSTTPSETTLLTTTPLETTPLETPPHEI